MVFNQQQAIEDIWVLTDLWDIANNTRSSESRREIMRLIRKREKLLDDEVVDMSTGKKEWDESLGPGKRGRLKMVKELPFDSRLGRRITQQERDDRFDADTARIQELIEP